MGRPHVVDQIERFVMGNYDYHGLERYDDDILLLEWDIAISREDLTKFSKRAEIDPSFIRVAPYRLYVEREHPVWAHRHAWSVTDVHVGYTDKTCDLFGFGCIYLPKKLIIAFLEADSETRARDPRYHGPDYKDTRFTDQTFSTWYHWHYKGPAVPIDWDIRPIHLNW